MSSPRAAPTAGGSADLMIEQEACMPMIPQSSRDDDQPPDPLDPDGLLGADELAALRTAGLPRPLPTRAALDLHGDTPVRVVSWRGRRRWRGLALAGLGMFRPATAPVHAGVQDGPGYCRE